MNRRRLALTVTVAAAILSAVGVALYFSPKAEPGTNQPPIAWTPDHVTVTLTPGESKQVQVTASIRSAVPATVADVVPALAPYVTVSPVVLSPMGAGSSQGFDLMVHVPAGATFETVDGTLHLRSGDTTVARPLSIVVNIWPSISLPSSGVTIVHPPAFAVFPATESQAESVGFYDVPDDFSRGLPPLYKMTVEMLPLGRTLEDWVGTFAPDAGPEAVTLADRVFLRWFESRGPGEGGVTSFSTLLPDGQRVVTFSSADDLFLGSPEFLAILSSLEST